jgi:hypothetical protein
MSLLTIVGNYKIMDLALVSNATTRNQFHTLKLNVDETHTQMAPCSLTSLFFFLPINTG